MAGIASGVGRGDRGQLRARRHGRGVPAVPALHEGCPAGDPALESLHLGRPAVSRKRAVGRVLAVQHPSVRAAVLDLARGHRGVQAVLRGPWDLRAGETPRDAFRRRAAGRAGLRVRHVLHRPAGLAGDQHLPALTVDAAARRHVGDGPRSAAGSGVGGRGRSDIPRWAPGDDLPRGVRRGRVLCLPAAGVDAGAARAAPLPATALARVRGCAWRRHGDGRGDDHPVRGAAGALQRVRAPAQRRRGPLAAQVLRRPVPARLLGPGDAAIEHRAVHAAARLVRRRADVDAGTGCAPDPSDADAHRHRRWRCSRRSRL